MLTPRQRSALRYKQRAPISIGLTRRQEKDAAVAHEQAVIRSAHEAVWKRSSCCQLCHGRRAKECIKGDEIHEDPSRAETRGWPAEERFNERVCGRLCEVCHRDVTQHRLRVVFEDEFERFKGAVRAEPI